MAWTVLQTIFAMSMSRKPDSRVPVRVVSRRLFDLRGCATDGTDRMATPGDAPLPGGRRRSPSAESRILLPRRWRSGVALRYHANTHCVDMVYPRTIDSAPLVVRLSHMGVGMRVS